MNHSAPAGDKAQSGPEFLALEPCGGDWNQVVKNDGDGRRASLSLGERGGVRASYNSCPTRPPNGKRCHPKLEVV